jgi:hypothetical protein
MRTGPTYIYLSLAAGAAAGAAAGTGTADFFAGFAGRLLPNDPLNIFPFFVFLSPLPIMITLNEFNNFPATSAGGQRYESSGIRH